jgi:hypothetical protein
MSEFRAISCCDPCEPTSRSWRIVADYQRDHRNPINHFLHVGVGWPMAAIAVIVLPFRPLWSLALFLAAYTVMFCGHFVFERNVPTVFKHPRTPFVVAWSVIRGLCGGVARLAAPLRVR